MRRRAAALLAAILVGSLASVAAPAGPASATLCAAIGSAEVIPGLYYPVQPPLLKVTGNQVTVEVHNPHRVASWTFGFTAGGCTTAGTTLEGMTAGGTLQGYCGHSTGRGTDTDGHLIAWTSIGGFMLLTHEVTGVARVDPNPLIAGNSCLHQPQLLNFFPGLPAGGGALTFTVEGVVWRVNCNINETLVTTLTPGLVGAFSQLLTLPFHVVTPTWGLVSSVHVRTPGIHAHLSLHVCVSSAKL